MNVPFCFPLLLSHSVGSSTFTETVTETNISQETGNSITGNYSRTINSDITTMTDNDHGTDAAGSFLVTESSSQTASGTQTGNNITSAYSLSETSTGSYSMTETGTPPGGSAFTLSETGSLTSTTNESGNSIVGSYNRSITGSDSYHMTETGTNTGGSFSESVTGNDTYTLTEAGNPANQTYNRTIAGSGSFTRSDTGAGATLPSNSGSISYNLTESADARAGNLSQTETGGDRYTLLEHFNNVANTGGGNDPGNMNFLPFGQPFVDPNPDDGFVYPWDSNARWSIGSALTGLFGSSVYRCEKMRALQWKSATFAGNNWRFWPKAKLPTLPNRANSQCFAPINGRAAYSEQPRWPGLALMTVWRLSINT